MLNTATSLISDVIGKHESSAAFVYGCYSFFDKTANGIILYFVTALWLNADSVTEIKWIMSIVPIFCAIVAFLFTFLGRWLYADRMAKLTMGGSVNTKGTRKTK